MRKRVVSWSLIALLALSAATFGTARARQLSSTNAAETRFVQARTLSDQALSRAAADGVSALELRPFQARSATLSRVQRPEAMPWWDPSGARYYQQQRRAYRTLAAAIQAYERSATVKSRAETVAQLAGLTRDVGVARSLDVPVTAPQASLSDVQRALARAATVRSYHALAASLLAARAALRVPTETQSRHVRGLLASAGGNLAGVLAWADTTTASARDSLGLLRLLTRRAAAYDSQLTRLNGVVHAQRTAFNAAVKSGPLETEVKLIAADYAKTVPTKMIVVSTENQRAEMYERGQVVYSSDVTTGGPELPTDHGVFHIYFKASPFVFHSPWPVGSPYYYNPTPVQFWMPFNGGEGLHDASWRSNFGPGSDLAPTDLGTGNTILGTHGCVNLPLAAAQFVWDWAPLGTTVVVV